MTDQQLQDYASGKLPPEEAEIVAKAVAGDSALAKKVAAYEKIFAALRRERLDEIEEELEEFIEELPVPGEEKEVKEVAAKVVPMVPKPRWGRYLGWAAGVAAVVLLGVIFWPDSGYSREEIVADFIEFPENENTAGIDDDTQQVFDSAKEHYFAGRYAEAETVFKQLLDSTEFRSAALYYLPFVLYQQDNFVAAGEAFATAIEVESYTEERKEALRWNAMLNELRQDKDITKLLAEDWSDDYPIEELRAKMKELSGSGE